MALKTCKECGTEVSSSAKQCPHCGVKNPGVTAKDMLIGAVLFGFMGFMLVKCSSDDDKPAKTSSPQVEDQHSSAHHWYEGGTLHRANALAWQRATYDNKLATCADLISVTWKNNKFNASVKSTLTSVNSIKPYAESLVRSLDVAFKPLADNDQNRELFENQKVSDVAVSLMNINGWLKK